MRSCEEVTLDLEKSKFVPLGLKDRMIMRAHVMMCSKCRQYFKDSGALDRWLKEGFEKDGIRYTFSDEEKDRLKNMLKEE